MMDAVQLGEHRSALTSLVHDLHDPTSAEIYCTLGGEIVPPKTAQSLGDRFELQAWAALIAPPTPSGKAGIPKAPSMSRLATVDGDLKKSLIRTLLEVYMSGGESTAERTAKFLNAQAMNLDVLDVSHLTNYWPCWADANVSIGHLPHTTRLAAQHLVHFCCPVIPPNAPRTQRGSDSQSHQREPEFGSG